MRFITGRTSHRWPYVEPATLTMLYQYDPSVRLAICLVFFALGLAELWGYYGTWQASSTQMADIAWGCGGTLLGFIVAVAEGEHIRGREDEIIARLLAKKERKRGWLDWRPGLIGAAAAVAVLFAHVRWGYGWDHILIALVGGFFLGNLLAFPLWRKQWWHLRQAANAAQAAALDGQGGL